MTEPIQPNDYTSVIEVFTDPISVLQVETRGPQGRPGPAGDPGPSGPPGVRFYEEFDPEKIYLPGDLVTYNGVLYFSTHTSVDGAPPTDVAYWTPISYNSSVIPPVIPKFTSLVPMGTAVEIAHNLNTEYVNVRVRDMATKEEVYPGVNILDPDHIELTFGYLSSNPVDGTFHVTVERDA